MGCSSSVIPTDNPKTQILQLEARDNSPNEVEQVKSTFNAELALSSSIVIQKWYRRYKARLDLRRHCSWKIFQEIEYSAEHDQINLYNFFNEMVANVEHNNNHPSKGFAGMLGKVRSQHNHDHERESLDEVMQIQVPDTYKGPHVTLPVTLETTKQLIKQFKSKKLLHPKYVKMLLLEAKNHFSKLPNVINVNLSISKQVTVVGDLHGKFLDLITIFNKNGFPSPENPYIFNGDFVDRGKRSLEILLILCCFHLMFPDYVVLNRGNHEDYIMNSRYGFTKEITNKYKVDAGRIMELCSNVFSWLPLATIIGNKIFVTHGGVSDRTDVDKIMNIRREQFSSVLKPTHVSLDEVEPPSMKVLQDWEQVLDLLWSDPQIQPGKVFNRYRGGGCCFGPDITAQVLKKYGWDLIIRSHECKFEGYEYAHDGKLLTIFSVSSYYANSSNLGAYVKIDFNLNPRIIQFDVPRSSLGSRVGINEDTATQDLKHKIYSNKEQLMKEFVKLDPKDEGKILLHSWANVMESVLQMKLPWYLLRPKLVVQDNKGCILYNTLFEGYKIDSTLPQLSDLSESIYRNKDALYTVFRIIDKDCSGFISKEEFEEACRILNDYSSDIIPLSSASDLAKALDINKDGKIDFNEFLEAFRLVSLSVGERENDSQVKMNEEVGDIKESSVDGTEGVLDSSNDKS